ncbi:cytochrome c1 [Alphaproteobacteria bacterium]|nr:cytochrome c1 [Alphaproteobacteria bacterium]
MKIPSFIFFFIFFNLNLVVGAETKIDIPKYDWSWKGFFGTYDRSATQRGFKVYKEVCSGCHSMNLIAYRNLGDLGFSEQQIKAIASDSLVEDGPNDEGDMFEREAIPSDRFVNPYPNDNAARAANNGAYPPDLSLIVKARPKGADYIHSLLLGYTKTPDDFNLPDGMWYNKYMEGHLIAMPAPLTDGAIEYDDGTVPTLKQLSSDVTTFLAWAAEPSLEHRKRLGVKVMLFLLALFILTYISKQKIWRDVKH